VASEFCGTSIASQGPPQARLDAMRAENPHMRFANSEKRGYVTLDLTGKRCLSRLRVVDSEKLADSGITTLATFVVEDGQPGPQQA
jgi:alkaline phosphatase D